MSCLSRLKASVRAIIETSEIEP